ncbi:proline-, glutamic acid- and leucine-rich protein 1 [Macadamia integrifolia]|uniref:proline-, glutamic acid- and leucine-rich protein 1 n=1 Tax=Macadamia integrifolia TaxID=60698 RepID=UPI001C4E6233|nr:proline-, glutamic acid- and leucine-rich protein 1 [Macadamia integrifolia]
MAVEHFQNMYDIRLKPRLLRSLMRDYLPDDKRPSPSPSKLSDVVSAIKTHGLLLEPFREPVDQKQIDNWKSSIDAWVERLLLLISSKMPDKCWAGTCLLGVTCQECSTDRFLASYSVWFQKLISQIQPPSDSHFVKVATCASLSDMLTRLGGISSVKKDGTSHAGKLIQPVLKLLTEDSSEAVWDGAVVLLCNIITFFPYSVHRHYDSVEAVIASKIMSGKCSENISKKLSHCLALLPKSRGDEDSWSLMMQKILISINVHLNDAFQGLEEETKCNEAKKCLVPPGKEPPPPLGGQTMSGEASDQAIKRSEKLIIPRVSMLVLCCSTMLTNPYPVQVTVPVRPLLALVSRVLSLDGSLSKALLSFVTVMQQEYICSELPVLHSHSLDLLVAIIKGVRSQLLPHAADVGRLLTEYFRRCAHPSLRIKVYSIMQMLLTSMGVGMALCLAQEVINNAFVDLDSVSHGHESASSKVRVKATTESLQQPRHRKRKHITAAGSLEEHQNGIGSEGEVHENKPKVPTSVQIAALQALEVLLTVGGALRSEFWRANVDLLLITVATNACNGGWANEAKGTFDRSHEPASTWADFQLAALHALLASLLSPSHVRPPYLSQGLELFRRGKQETGTKLAEFCAHAILVLEVLIHPRALPLGDFTSGSHDAFAERVNWRFPENTFSAGLKPNQFPGVIMGLDEPDPDDDLYNSWLSNGEETEAPVSVQDKQLESAVEPCEKRQTNGDSQAEKISSEHSAGDQALEEGNRRSMDDADVEMERGSDGIMVQSEQLLVSMSSGYVETLDKSLLDPTQCARDEVETSKSALDGNTFDASTIASLSSKISLDSDMDGKGATPAAGKGPVFDLNSDSSMDSFPDIVDADPDSD